MTGGVSGQLPIPGADPSLSPNVCAETVQATTFREWNFHRWWRRHQRLETSAERTAERREPFMSCSGRNIDLIVPVK